MIIFRRRWIKVDFMTILGNKQIHFTPEKHMGKTVIKNHLNLLRAQLFTNKLVLLLIGPLNHIQKYRAVFQCKTLN